jgi:hypothetical protein
MEMIESSLTPIEILSAGATGLYNTFPILLTFINTRLH